MDSPNYDYDSNIDGKKEIATSPATDGSTNSMGIVKQKMITIKHLNDDDDNDNGTLNTFCSKNRMMLTG